MGPSGADRSRSFGLRCRPAGSVRAQRIRRAFFRDVYLWHTTSRSLQIKFFSFCFQLSCTPIDHESKTSALHSAANSRLMVDSGTLHSLVAEEGGPRFDIGCSHHPRGCHPEILVMSSRLSERRLRRRNCRTVRPITRRCLCPVQTVAATTHFGHRGTKAVYGTSVIMHRRPFCAG